MISCNKGRIKIKAEDKAQVQAELTTLICHMMKQNFITKNELMSVLDVFEHLYKEDKE